MDGFARRKEQSKEEIRKAAWDLFSQFGFDRVSIMDIAQKAGVSQATIYNNFGSKEALVREFVAAAIQQLVDRVQTVLLQGDNFSEMMVAFTQLIATMMTEGNHSAANRMIFLTSIDLQNDTEIKRVRMVAQEKMTGLLLNLVRSGRQQGKIDPEISDAALSIYFRMFMDLFTNPEFQNDVRNQPDLVKELGSLMMNGLNG